MAIEGRYRRADGAPTTVEVVAIPSESRYMMVKFIRIINPHTRPILLDEETLTVARSEIEVIWSKGNYKIKLMFRNGQLVVIESGVEAGAGIGIPVDGLYQKAGVVVR